MGPMNSLGLSHIIAVELAIVCRIVTAPRLIEFRLIKLISDLLMDFISQRDGAHVIRLAFISIGSLVPILANDNLLAALDII
jgi:hypothetical protein